MSRHGKGIVTVLAGDVGGTKTHLGLYVEGKGRPRLSDLETFPSQESLNLEGIVARFLQSRPAPVKAACFGIAGPVMRGKSRITNLPWRVSEDRLKRRFQWSRVRLINDLNATALAVPLLSSSERVPLNNARGATDGNLGLIAPGTGLGEALLVFDGRSYIAVPSEGGHTDFSPATKNELWLWEYLHERYGHVSMERLLSGPGLLNIYSWLRDLGRFKEPRWLSERLRGEDPARVISEVGLNKRNLMCRETLKLFASILGGEAGNLALKGMTLGGIYLGGGIPPKILDVLREDAFLAAFANKGRFSGLMKRIPVRVILNDKAALLGAARCALGMVSK